MTSRRRFLQTTVAAIPFLSLGQSVLARETQPVQDPFEIQFPRKGQPGIDKRLNRPEVENLGKVISLSNSIVKEFCDSSDVPYTCNRSIIFDIAFKMLAEGDSFHIRKDMTMDFLVFLLRDPFTFISSTSIERVETDYGVLVEFRKIKTSSFGAILTVYYEPREVLHCRIPDNEWYPYGCNYSDLIKHLSDHEIITLAVKTIKEAVAGVGI